MTTLEDLRRRRPGNRENIDRIKADMYVDATAYRLRALPAEKTSGDPANRR